MSNFICYRCGMETSDMVYAEQHRARCPQPDINAPPEPKSTEAQRIDIFINDLELAITMLSNAIKKYKETK